MVEPVLTPAPRSFRPFPLLQGDSGKYLFALLVVALAARLIPAWAIYGTDDVGAWRLVVTTFQIHENPYLTGKLNWPPLWPTLLIYSGRLQTVYGLPDYFAVKVVPIGCDCALAVALYVWFLNHKQTPRQAWRLGLWYALNPVAILICAVHGQFDALPALFSLLAVMAQMQTQPNKFSWQAAGWLSLGILAKTWPIALIPLFVRPLRTAQRRAGFVVLALAPTISSLLILYSLTPIAIAKYVLQYRSAPGWWGLTLPLPLLASPHVREVWAQMTQWSLYAVWIALYAVLWKRGSLAQAACLIVLAFYVFTPGFGPQYLVWIVGLAMLGDRARLRSYTLLTAFSLLIVYLYTPFNGTYLGFISRVRSPEFWAGHATPHHALMNGLCLLPLWAFCGWWLCALLRDVCRDSSAPTPRENEVQ